MQIDSFYGRVCYTRNVSRSREASKPERKRRYLIGDALPGEDPHARLIDIDRQYLDQAIHERSLRCRYEHIVVNLFEIVAGQEAKEPLLFGSVLVLLIGPCKPHVNVFLRFRRALQGEYRTVLVHVQQLCPRTIDRSDGGEPC